MRVLRAARLSPWTAVAVVFILTTAARASYAEPITVIWDPGPPEESILGYVVHAGTASGVYTLSFDVGNQTSFIYPDALPGQKYFFAVAAYNATGMGAYSSEVSGYSNAPPLLVNPGAQVDDISESASLQLVGSDPDGEPVTYDASGLPPGLTLTPSTGLISGQPSTVGVYSVDASVSDGLLSTTTSFTWYIGDGPPDLAITSPTAAGSFATQAKTIGLGGTASDELGVASVTWVNDRGGSGTASGTTTWSVSSIPLQLGANVVTVTATDIAGYTSAAAITITVTDTTPPTIAMTSPTSAAAFSTSSSTVEMGGTTSDSWATTSVTWVNDRGGNGTGSLSVGQFTTIWATGTISLQRGTNVITATAWDASGNGGSVVLTVDRLNNVPTLANPGNRTSAEGDGVTLQLAGSDPDGDPLTYSSADLPPGLTLNASSGLISGTLPYTAAGAYATTFAVSDGADTAQVSITWTVTNANRSPILVDPGAQGAYQGVAVATAMTATDADGDPIAWTASNLPPGLGINASTGVISGTPTTTGSFAVTLAVSDGVASAQIAVNWSVTSPLPPASTPLAPSGATVLTTPTFSWAASSSATYYLLWIEDVGKSVIQSWYTPAQAGCGGGTGTCSAAAPRPLGAGRVQWKVLTWNPYGYGPWSGTMSVVIDLADPSTPTPSVVGPSGPIATRTPSYTWTAASSAVSYQLSVTDAGSTVREFWYAANEACPASPCGATPNVLLAIGPAQWRLRAWRSSGAGAWTTAVGFETADSAPGKATLVAPAAPVSTATPSFSWTAVLGTSYYLLRIIDRDNATVERWYRPSEAACPLGTGTCTVSPGFTIKAGPASWRVLTWNGSGYGPWSDTRQFSVEVPDPSALPPAPLDPTGSIATPNVTYRWTAVAGAQSYRLWIRNNVTDLGYWWYSPAAAGCAASAQCSATPQVGLQNGTAEWQVQTWTTIGHSDWSAPIGLTVSIPAPPAPVLVSPSGATTASPSFSWNAAGPATLYYVRAYDSVGLRVDRWLTPSEAGCPTGTGLCTLNPAATFASGAGSWQVIAWNPTGYSPWSSTLSFIVP